MSDVMSGRDRVLRLRERRGRIRTEPEPQPTSDAPMQFSLYFFSSDETLLGADKYQLVRAAARFADENGFTAIWTPERHFHPFGGLYPSPSTLSAALGAITERIGVRAGSVVMPLHHPVRVAEEWSVIDNLSGGRVGVSFASGWSPRDFVFAPDAWPDRQQRLFDGIDEVRRLWRGEPRRYRAGTDEIDVVVHPRPVQPELPVWVTSGGGRGTCERAGEIGANLLTALIRQTPRQAADNIAAYRDGRVAAGHDPRTGHVTMMMHTYLGPTVSAVHDAVSGPLSTYLTGFLDLLKDTAGRLDPTLDLGRMSESERAGVIEHALDRYLTTNGLFGTPSSVGAAVARFREMGVDEIACLLDFGLDDEVVMAGLAHLAELREQVAAGAGDG